MDLIIPKKSLGQHWLYDEDVLKDIVELSEIKQGEPIVEIGPGLGTLTEHLLASGAHVTAVEFDFDLYKNLKKKAPSQFGKNSKNLRLINQDILGFRFDEMPEGYKVVANIPYYLSSNLIRTLSEAPVRPKLVTLLIQKEVAERLCADAGDMSLLSVWAQMYFECVLGPVVPAKLFTPPPNVDSQVVVMKSRENPIFGKSDKKVLTRVIKAGFSNKRKTLHNSLSAGLGIDKDAVSILLDNSSIGLKARPQELSLEEWIRVSDKFAKNDT